METFRIPHRGDHQRTSQIHLQLKHKERTLKVARKKHQVIYKGVPIRITVGLPTKITIARKTQNSTQATKDRSCQKITISRKKSFIVEWERKVFCEKHKLKEVITTKPTPKKVP